jgi:hypothetical protein
MRLRHLAIGAVVLALGMTAGPALAKPPAASPQANPACAASQLSLTVPQAIAGDPTQGMGKLAWNILLGNTGRVSCSLSGWPGLRITVAGKPVAITSQDVSFSNLATVRPQLVTLAAGQQAVVTVQASDNTAGCRANWGLTLRLPGAAGSLTATQAPSFFGPCAGGLLRLSPFYPRSVLARAIAGLQVAHSPSPFRTTKAVMPVACTPQHLRVAASYSRAAHGGSVTVLRLVSRGSGACVLPGEWPTITLHATGGTTQIAKVLAGLPRGVTRSPLTVYQRAHPVSTNVTLSRGTAASIALVTRTSGPGACHVATTATIYPRLTSTGTGLTVRLAQPVTFCGLPRVLSFLAGRPPVASLMAAAQSLISGMSPFGDSPAGFWYGSDSNAPVPCCRNSSGVWLMPDSPVGGDYGGYVGELGAYDVWKGCTSGINWNQTGYNDAEGNFVNHNVGVGAGGYWMMAGPGREPGGYTTSGTNATNWGTSQAQRAISDVGQTLGFGYIFMDIEAVVPHGWNAGWAGVCSNTETASFISSTLDRDTFNGFWNQVWYHSSFFIGVYDAGGGGPNSWSSVFGSQTLGNTSEWTYVNETSSISAFPSGFCVGGTCAVWFASAPSGCQMLWQWSGGNGQLNGVGDFDQIDGNRKFSCA